MKTIIGVMGPGSNATDVDLKNAFEIGKFCAQNGYVTLTGGRNEGVMNEALKGAREYEGITLGILPSDDRDTFSPYLDIPVCTNMRSGRNYINVLSSDIVVACGMDHGTSSEISLSIKPGKKVILVGLDGEANNFYKKLAPEQVFLAKNFEDAVVILQKILHNSSI